MLYAIPPADSAIKRVERINDCLLLYADAGILRLSPKGVRTVRVTFTKEKEFSNSPRPGIVEPDRVFGEWEYEESDDEIALRTSEVVLKVDRATGSIRYFDKCGRLLLSETEKDSRSFEKFEVFKMVDARIEKVQTADGVKEVVREAERVPDGHSWHARLNLEFQDGEALYGLGQHEEGFGNLRGQTVYLHQANRKIAIPMLVSSLGYGILMDTYSPLIFSDTLYGSYIYSEAVPELDFYFMYGVDMRGVIKEYRMITGRAAMLPRWAFGYIQSQEKYDDQAEIERTVTEYRERGIGLDCIVLDWCSWEDGKWGQKTFDKSRFPDPKGMTDFIRRNHARFMISVWANMNESCENYAEFKEAGLFLPSQSIYNALSEDARKLYWEQAKRGLYQYGVDAWWCDNSEPLDPEWEHRERVEPARMYEEYCRNVANHIPAEQTNAFGLYHSQGIYEGQRQENDGKRVCNLTRSSYTGQQRYGTILWSGDVAATWDTLKRQIAAGLNFSASGLPYWTTDIGAFFVKRGLFWYWRGDFPKCTEDLGYREFFTRWYQWAAFLPIFRGHGTDCRRELWHFANADVPFYDAIMKMNRLRYELMPYIYSAAGLCTVNDGSMMTPLAFDYPDDEVAKSITDQYMFGDSIMVCPVTSPMYYKPDSEKIDAPKSRKVYLPEGGWYDFYTNEYLSGGRWIDASAPIDVIPLYVREGSIIPTCEPAQSTDELSGEITLKVYSGKDAEYTLYEDEFDGYGYENGRYILTDIRWNEHEQKLSTEKKTSWDMSPEDQAKRYKIINTVIIKKED